MKPRKEPRTTEWKIGPHESLYHRQKGSGPWLFLPRDKFGEMHVAIYRHLIVQKEEMLKGPMNEQ